MNGIALEDSLYTSSSILQPWICTTGRMQFKQCACCNFSCWCLQL